MNDIPGNSESPARNPDASKLERFGMAWPPSAQEAAEWHAPRDIDSAHVDRSAPPGRTTHAAPSAAGAWVLVKDVVETVLLAALLTGGLHFVVQAREVLGSSMEPTLHTGQRILVSRVSYGAFGAPQRGHIVVFDSWGDETDYVKRIVGLPGDTIEIRDGRVFVNEVALDEPYLDRPAADRNGPIQLGPDEYYVLGDNRANSADSRYYGPLPADRIIGRAWLSMWPIADFGVLQY